MSAIEAEIRDLTAVVTAHLQLILHFSPVLTVVVYLFLCLCWQHPGDSVRGDCHCVRVLLLRGRGGQAQGVPLPGRTAIFWPLHPALAAVRRLHLRPPIH
jgi:hypothetical protein